MATREQLIEDFADHKYATGEKFARLINSMKVVQEPVTDPQASGTSHSFIDSISQSADGKITATKKSVVLNYVQIQDKPTINGVTLMGDQTAAQLGLATANQVGALSDKVDKLPSGYYYGKFNSVEDLPEATEKGYAYVASSDPTVFYTYLVSGAGAEWLDSGNKMVNTVDLTTPKAVGTELSKGEKYYASANVNDRPADVVIETGVVRSLGYRVLNPALSFALQVVEANTIYEVRDNFVIDTEISVPTNITLRYNGGTITGNGHIYSNDDTLKIEGLKVNNGVYAKGYNLNVDDNFLTASQIGMMEGASNGSLNATIMSRVIANSKNITLDGDYYFERYNNSPFSIGYDFTVKGGTARFVASITESFFTITAGGGITFDSVEFYNNNRHYFIRISNIDYVFDKICFYNCVFNNRTTYIYITAPDIDYGETPFGCKKVIVDGCEFKDAGQSFLLPDVVVSDEFKVVNNTVNFVGTFVNIGQNNGRTYNASNKLYWCDVVFDNNTFLGKTHITGSGEYYTPVVAETNRVFYTNNIIKNLIAIDGYSAYECYLSANYVIISGNNITDVMSLKHKHITSDNFAFSETGKAKGSHFLSIKNNYWDVDANRVRQLCEDAGITFNESIRIKKLVTTESIPTFAVDTYYSWEMDFYPKLLTEEPQNWSSNYTKYYRTAEEGEEDSFVVNEWDCTAKYEKFKPNYGYKLLFFENNEVHLKNLIYGEANTIVYSKNVEVHINRNLFDLTRTNKILIGIYGIYSDDANEKKVFEFVGNTINLENGTHFAPCTPLYFPSGVPTKVNCNALIANNISNVNLVPASLVTKSVFKNNIVTPIQLNQAGYIYDSDITDIDINWVSVKSGFVYFYPAKMNVKYTPNEIYGYITYEYKNRILHFICNKLGLDVKIIMVVDGNNISIYNIFGKLIGQFTKSNLEFYIWNQNSYTNIKLLKSTTDFFLVRLNKANYDFGEVEIDSDTFDVTKFNISNSDIKYQSNGAYGIFEGTKYVDFNGRTSAKTSGTSAERPTTAMLSTDAGFVYYDTDLGKPIFWSGSTWDDANGETVGLQVSDTSILIGATDNSTKNVHVYYSGTTPTITVLNSDDTANTWLTAAYTLYAPTFVANTYYSVANTKVATKPSNWETNYMDYFTDAEATIPVAGVPKNEVVFTAAANTTSAPRGAKVLVTLGDELVIINVVQTY